MYYDPHLFGGGYTYTSYRVDMQDRQRYTERGGGRGLQYTCVAWPPHASKLPPSVKNAEVSYDIAASAAAQELFLNGRMGGWVTKP